MAVKTFGGEEMREFLLAIAFVFIMMLSLWAGETQKTISFYGKQIKVLECQVERLLHPGLTDEKCGGE